MRIGWCLGALAVAAVCASTVQPWSLAAAASSPQVLVAGEILRGHFVQERQLAGFAHPLRSEGSFILVPGRGLIWHNEKPFNSTTIITAGGILQLANGQEAMRLSAAKLPGLAQLYGVLGAALSGNTGPLQQTFTVSQTTDADNWRVELKPLSPNAQAMSQLRRLVLAGARYVESVEVNRTGGDTDRIAFSAHKIAKADLTPEEVRTIEGGRKMIVRRLAAIVWILAILSAVGYLGVRLASGVTLESNILALLPHAERDASVQLAGDRLANAMARRFGFLVGSHSSQKAAAAAHLLAAELKRSGTIASLSSSIDPDAQNRMGAAYFPYRAGLLSDGDRTALTTGHGGDVKDRAMAFLYGVGGLADSRLLARDPFFLLPNYLLNLPQTQSKLTVDGDVLTVRDGAITYALVSGDLAGAPYSLDFQKSFDKATSDAIGKMKQAAPDLTILRTGAVFYAHDAAQEALNETSLIGIASLVGTMALILLVFGGIRPIMLDALAIGAGIICAFLGTLMVFGQVHVLSLLFGVSLIGISVDYSLQYFCEYFDPEAPDSVTRLRRVLPGLAIGLSTTLIGYCTLLLAPFPGLKQVATFSVIGLSVSCLTVILCYPLFDRHRPSQPGNRFVRIAATHWSLWEAKRLAVVRIVLLSALAVAAIFGIAKFKVDDDVHHFQSLSPDLRWQESEFARLTGTPAGTQFLLLRAANPEALLQMEEGLAPQLAHLKRTGAIGDFTAIAQYVPSVARQKENRALVRDSLMAPLLPGYLAAIGYDGTPNYPIPEKFLTPADLPTTGPFALVKLLDVSGAGQAAHVLLLRDVRDAAAVRAVTTTLPGARFVSLADDWSSLFGEYRRYALALLALSVALMYPLLALRYGLRRAVRVLVPSFLAVGLAPPIAALVGIPFTFFNAMALVLVLSVGVDYSVFCAETGGARKPVTTLAIAMAALGTILAFGMLAFSRVFAVHAFGMTMLIGIFIAWLFAPAVGDSGRAR